MDRKPVKVEEYEVDEKTLKALANLHKTYFMTAGDQTWQEQVMEDVKRLMRAYDSWMN